MDSIHRRPPPNKTPPHDPDVCRIDYAHSCAACRAAWDAQAGPPLLSTPRRLWTWLCDRVPCLRRWRGTSEAAIEPRVTDEDRARLLYLLCEQQTREAVVAIILPDMQSALARRSGGAT